MILDQIVSVGRAKKNGIGRTHSEWNSQVRKCVCDGPIIRATGDVYPCGCADSPKIGNVNEPTEMLDYFLADSAFGGCWFYGDVYTEDDPYESFKRLYWNRAENKPNLSQVV